MAAYTIIPNVIFTFFIGFLDPENMGIATKTKFLWVSNTEILAKPNFGLAGGGHFEMQGWEIRGVLIYCSVWSYELVKKTIQFVVIFSGSKPNTPVLLRTFLLLIHNPHLKTISDTFDVGYIFWYQLHVVATNSSPAMSNPCSVSGFLIRNLNLEPRYLFDLT